MGCRPTTYEFIGIVVNNYSRNSRVLNKIIDAYDKPLNGKYLGDTKIDILENTKILDRLTFNKNNSKSGIITASAGLFNYTYLIGINIQTNYACYSSGEFQKKIALKRKKKFIKKMKKYLGINLKRYKNKIYHYNIELWW